eukprot:m.64500 g.64500  ORF g.64500 m.64500 type:complete len:633 (+) comp8116_c2_seq1:112-2010(+)
MDSGRVENSSIEDGKIPQKVTDELVDEVNVDANKDTNCNETSKEEDKVDDEVNVDENKVDDELADQVDVKEGGKTNEVNSEEDIVADELADQVDVEKEKVNDEVTNDVADEVNAEAEVAATEVIVGLLEEVNVDDDKVDDDMANGVSDNVDSRDENVANEVNDGEKETVTVNDGEENAADETNVNKEEITNEVNEIVANEVNDGEEEKVADGVNDDVSDKTASTKNSHFNQDEGKMCDNDKSGNGDEKNISSRNSTPEEKTVSKNDDADKWEGKHESDEYDHEEVDPRVEGLLEEMNQASDDINLFEVKYDEVKRAFEETLKKLEHELGKTAKKFGKKTVEKAKHYHIAMARARRALLDTKKSARQFETYLGKYNVVKEELRSVERKAEELGRIDEEMQEMLNKLTAKMMRASELKRKAEKVHINCTQLFAKRDEERQKLATRFKKSIEKTRPYFKAKVGYDHIINGLRVQLNECAALTKEAKRRSGAALNELSRISEEIHMRRQEEKLAFEEKNKNKNAQPSKAQTLEGTIDSHRVENIDSRSSSLEKELEAARNQIEKQERRANEQWAETQALMMNAMNLDVVESMIDDGEEDGDDANDAISLNSHADSEVRNYGDGDISDVEEEEERHE